MARKALSATQRTNITLLVAALGYFVDAFDIQLFSVLRVSSLQSLGLSGDELTRVGAMLVNWQMAGFILGGIIWGVLGDKKGRVSVLFGTILLYSLANIANAFVTTIPHYAAARFFTGIGLAGELGAGVTLLSELLPKEKRAKATSIMIACGLLGPVFASLMGNWLDWRHGYIAGGVLGLLLLAMRIAVAESGMFDAVKNNTEIARGKFFDLFAKRERFIRYLGCVAMAVPLWFVAGMFLIFAPEIGAALGIIEPVQSSYAVMTCYTGIAIGSFVAGLLSEKTHSRKKIMAVFLTGTAITDLLVLNAFGVTPMVYYALMGLAGFFVGIWSVMALVMAELFGTNLRATASTSASNFVRGSLMLDIMLAGWLKPTYGTLTSFTITATVGLAIAFVALWKIPETYGRDLDFIEK